MVEEQQLDSLLDLLDQKPSKNPTFSLEDFLDPSIDTVSDLKSSENSPDDELNAEEVEELEWLSNKDAFPSLETSFPTQFTVVPLPPSFKVPVKKRSVINRKRRRIFPRIFPRLERRRCRHCMQEDTPQWRMGPEGPKTLCNACGVRYKKGRLYPEYRPANSPTFSAELHSNSTRRIIEMRTGTAKRGRPRLAVM